MSENLQEVINTVNVAAIAQQAEFKAYNQARSDGNFEALSTHLQAYRKAQEVLQKANEVLAQSILNTSELQNDLVMLVKANAAFAQAAKDLANNIDGLQKITKAANAVIAVLGVISLL